jgi:integrase/recombinase XerD
MAITTKIILKTHKTLPDGNHPIVLRITENRRLYEVATKKSATLGQWDDRSQSVFDNHPNHKSINALLNNIKVKLTFLLRQPERNSEPACQRH